MVYDPFNVLMNDIFKNFIKKSGIYGHEKDWSVIFFSIVFFSVLVSRKYLVHRTSLEVLLLYYLME
jgi:hypothetical protein